MRYMKNIKQASIDYKNTISKLKKLKKNDKLFLQRLKMSLKEKNRKIDEKRRKLKSISKDVKRKVYGKGIFTKIKEKMKKK